MIDEGNDEREYWTELEHQYGREEMAREERVYWAELRHEYEIDAAMACLAENFAALLGTP